MWIKIRSIFHRSLDRAANGKMSELASLEDLSLSLKDIEGVVKKHVCERGGGKFQVVECQVRRFEPSSFAISASNFIVTVDLKEKKVRYADENSDTDSCEEQTSTFFVKSLPHTEFGLKYTENVSTFRKECRLYQQLVPRLQDVGIGHRAWASHCYLAEEDRAIVLENLNESGFVVCNSRDLDLAHLEVTVGVLARMHAASIALEMRTRADVPDLYPGLLDENAYPEETEGYRRTGVQTMTQTLVELTRKLPGYDEWDKNEAIEAFPGVVDRIFELVKPSTSLQNVFSHGDIWANNILFKYDEEIQQVGDSGVSAVRRVPVDARFVDFQFSRYVPPTYDIAVLLYTSTTRQFRDEHKQHILDVYYAALDEDLSAYGFVTGDIMSLTSFHQSYETYKLAGLIENLLFNQVIYLPQDFWANMSTNVETFEEFLTQLHSKICSEAFEAYPIYRDKIEDLLREIIDDYVLKTEWNQRL